MADITTDFYLEQISKYPKNHWKARLYKKKVEEIISGYRVTAHKEKGTFTSSFCSQQANYLESRLKEVIKE